MTRISSAVILIAIGYALTLAGCAASARNQSPGVQSNDAAAQSDPPALGAGLGDFSKVVVSEASWGSWLADDLDGMVRNSELIVVGKVDGVSSVAKDELPLQDMPFTPEIGKDPQRPTRPFVLRVNTTFNFTIDGHMKGSSATNKIRVRQASGVADGVLYRFGDDMPLVPGERYLLFLTPSVAEPTAFETTAFISGQFPIRNGQIEAAYKTSKLARLLGGLPEADAVRNLAPIVARAQ